MRTERILVVLAVAVVGGYLLVWWLPAVSVRQVPNLNELQQEQLLLETRKTNAQILGGGALLLGLFFTWWNLRIAEEGHFTERFTKAVDQLGSEKIEQRVGAIYALERLTADSRKDHPAIMEIICSFLRHRVRQAEEADPYKVPVGERKRDDYDMLVKMVKAAGYVPPPPEDVRAAASVLRRNTKNLLKPYFLDLSGADLRGVNLEKARLRGANLSGVYGERSNFRAADLRGARLYNARMKMANFDHADLRDAVIEDAEFLHADFRGANLRGAKLREDVEYEFGFESEPDLDKAMDRQETVNFEYSDLRDALVEGLAIEGANFRHANLSSAKGLTPEQIDKAFGNSKTQLPIGWNRPSEWQDDERAWE